MQDAFFLFPLPVENKFVIFVYFFGGGIIFLKKLIHGVGRKLPFGNTSGINAQNGVQSQQTDECNPDKPQRQQLAEFK